MDHELKQRLIGAVVVTALCAIFIPMLFDDPVDNSGQVVSELSIPASGGSGADTAAKLPAGADQVLKLPDPEPLSTETAGDTLESTGAAEEVTEEPEAGQAEQGRSGESLYAESEGYTNAEETVEPEGNLPKQRQKQTPVSAEAAAPRLRPVEDNSIASKAQVRDIRAETAVKEAAAKVKKAVEPVKPVTVKKPEIAPPAVKTSGTPAEATPPPAVKTPSNAKSIAAAVAEAKKPEAAPKTNAKLVRWYIQLGSFSKKENAMSLWDSLREQGVPASLDTIETDKGTAYRLRVGPELDGKKAAAMKLRLDKQNIKAILISE
ncbi:sporulation related protein [Methylobacter tundripaludum]|uniref:Sporulation related protein n=1 Tax=Methylobacter tundripaludum TaxID=173365 RepID=A0A2S6H3M5_9GAMM|nr:SPOR domain-containing protein [Methylobacter tundripaludum]PPK72044.1 sporulation related protein [Methylobacter tundripaludum]